MKLSGALLVATLATACAAASIGACADERPDVRSRAGDRAEASPQTDDSPEDAEEAKPRAPLPTRSSAALARSIDGESLYLADEDHNAVRVVPLPLDASNPPKVVALAQPASVLALHDRVVVAQRDPGFVVSYAPTPYGLAELGRTRVPADAWGMAVTADERTLLVSSAWSGYVSALDLPSMKVRWSVPVAREPRGIAITSTGVAYVGHLVGRELTRIDDLAADTPRVTRVDLPPSPLRTPRGLKLGASLAYAPVLSPDDSELYVPRHALGAQGMEAWFGAPTVDVLLTEDDAPLAPNRGSYTPRAAAEFTESISAQFLFDVDGEAPLSPDAFTQPRAAVYRASTDTLLVASEGLNKVVELDARAVDPSIAQVRTYSFAKLDTSLKEEDPRAHVVVSGGAPSAIVLSPDEDWAYVYARSTNEIVSVGLLRGRAGEGSPGPAQAVPIAEGALSDDAEKGRRLFYDATDFVVSGGLGCAGCHPEGRDDGFVWSETANGFRGGPRIDRTGHTTLGTPRQTPMLAGRVAARGPYGWHGESKTLEDRIRAGFGLHNWLGPSTSEYAVTMDRPRLIATFIRAGLVEPPRDERLLNDEEARGKEVFEDPSVGCSSCHVPATGFTDRSVVALERDPSLRSFAEEEDRAFKTPSLSFVGGTPPYFHDGAARTLEDVVERNGDAMGHTAHLTKADRKALVAYLRRL